MDNCLIILVVHFPRKSIVFLSGERTERITMNRVVSLKERSVGRSAFVLVESKCCDISRAKIIFRDNEFSRAEGKRGEEGAEAAFPSRKRLFGNETRRETENSATRKINKSSRIPLPRRGSFHSARSR